MLKQKRIDIATTNISNLGSDLEKRVREAAGEKEAAWVNAGKAPGLQIWRIEKFKVKEVPAPEHGTFYSGDSYIVLHTYQKRPPALSWDIHFWLGANTTQDEAGTAAYKTVELDDHLHGVPVQYREVEGYESKQFLTFFPKGLHVLQGGMDSGFNRVAPESYKPRLLQIKGKKAIRVSEVPLAYTSLNSGDAFVLDSGLKIYVWVGSKASGTEKAKAQQVSNNIADQRNGRARVTVVDEGKDDDEFFKVLGGKGPIASAEAGGSDVDVAGGASSSRKVIKLFQFHEKSPGDFHFKQVDEGEKGVKKAHLDGSDVFVLDTGSEVIVWVGKGASAGEKKHALTRANDYLAKNGRSPFTPISKVAEGAESDAFTARVQ